jgi:hypothetical protein
MKAARIFCFSILGWQVVSAPVAAGQSILIGYTNCLAVTNYSQPLMDQIGQLKWYFAHASVGDCMMAGITALHQMNTNFYPIQGVSTGGAPSGAIQAGVIYNYMRGNPAWQVKVDTFQSYVSNGWRFPLVNLAMNKMCFIDPTADVNYYIKSMTNLETAFPETLFVYATMPLTMTNYDGYYNLYLRNCYNDGLRAWISTNNRVLFDLADIEAHDTNGVLCTFSYSNQVCQQLYSNYNTGDFGHPNTPYAEQLLAKGFYALAAGLMAVDRDHDGISDGQELIAGTRPGDPQSVFKLAAPQLIGPDLAWLQWNSASNRFYTLQRSTNLATAAGYTNLSPDVPATPPVNSYTDSPGPGGALFYRVRVRQ